MKLLIAILGSALALSATAADKVPAKELLRYTIGYTTELTFGDAQLSASPAKGGDDAASWEFVFQAEAAIPGFPIAEWTRGLATSALCSLEAEKKAVRGKRKTDEKTTFDSKAFKATRETVKGGKTEISIPACARDAVTYLYHLRRELAAGRLPQTQTVYYGAGYQVTVQFAGTQKVRSGEQEVEADRINVSIKGPAAKATAEAYFAKDAARTPVLVRVPVTAGTVILELVR